ncbi:MAG: amidophosphoribosyltransferase [Elusimicrobia bacterium]|nr:amidophosphoribosyltransferase [Elusimicrobiota bacterium]
MLKEECGIFGVWGCEKAAEMVFLGLFALQHRGQESAGIISARGRKFFSVKGAGLASEVFTSSNLKSLKGDMAIGHVRYSTSARTSRENIQPLSADFQNISIAVAHNGNIPRAKKRKEKLEKEGTVFSTGSDTEIIIKMLAREKGEWIHRLKRVGDELKGAFSLVMMLPGKLIAARDPFGFRPLCLGRKGDAFFVSSESCAFNLIGAEYIRDIKPGEILTIDRTGIKSLYMEKQVERQCIFELIYFSRPDSIVFSQSVYSARLEMGRELAREKKAEADLVMPVPDSANIQALGYSKESGVPLEFGFIRSHYVGRTFIEPQQRIRDFRTRIKHSPIKDVLKGKRVILIDDSIVRGTTSRKLVKLIREVGAKEISLFIASPPIKFPCFYGIDTPVRKHLLANRMNTDEIRKFLGVDDLYYLSLEGLLNSCRKTGYCLACFTGDYVL